MPSHNMISLLVFGLLFVTNLHISEAQIGVVYGTNGNNLPTPASVAGIIASNKITKVRLIEPNKDILTVLKGKNVEVLLGVANADVSRINDSASLAEKWVVDNVKPYVPDVKIKYIVVGNDLTNVNNNQLYAIWVPRTMPGIHAALQKHGLKDIRVTTAVDLSVLNQQVTDPCLPSNAEFTSTASGYLGIDILPRLKEYGSPLMASINPYYELIKHPNEKPALFTAKDGGVKDGKYTYENKFDIMLDSFYTALEKMNNTLYADMEVIVSETGWPSTGGVEASIENEKTYVTNLVQHVNKGTPKRPNKPIQVYLNLFDENQKGEAEIEKHFGVFSSDGKLKFPLAFTPSA